MKRNGMNFVKNRRLGFRSSNPNVDFDLDGNPVQSNYVAIVRINDCEIIERDGKRYYNAENAPSIPLHYGGTYYGYKNWTKRKSTRGKWVEGFFTHEYWQCTTYLVRDGYVYTGSKSFLTYN